ncbi:DNA/RNA non-specific endonuclease [Endozoicomonas sp. 4G]|uniref:DNA/RNA non-specific endonuclease n=1 Tax=Endozoicomonas sp. 4G TaxID=2872754 RepID=UPI0020790FA5|nr:DNA/RNA non-specific endonuclease [Endozoicomonas sp. 4G]
MNDMQRLKEFSAEQKAPVFNSFEKIELTPDELKAFDRPISESLSEGKGTVDATFESVVKDGKEVNSSVTRLSPGEKGNWNQALNEPPLRPDHTYQVGGYDYQTESEGRVSKVTGQLELSTQDRNTYQQIKSAEAGGIKDGREGDDGGHMIASIFNGPGEQINLLPMESNLNRGEWKRMENKWAAALAEEPPKQVSVEIRPIYEEGSKRPSSFDVFYEVDGKEHFSSFENGVRA